MPPRKQYSRPRRARPTQAKAKRVVAKGKKKMAKKNMDTLFLKAKTVGTITPVQGVTVTNYISNFFQLLATGGAWALVNNAEFNLYRTMYDRVRINSMKVTMIPKANTLDAVEAQDDANKSASGDGAIHTCIDRDGQVPGNIARISRYPSYKRFSLLKKSVRTYGIKYPTGIWLDCQDIFGNLALLNNLGATGGIYYYAENVIEDAGEVLNEPWAQCEIEYNCVFQGKTSANLSYDPQTGVVTLTPDSQLQVLPDTPFTALYGTIEDYTTDISGNLVRRTDTSTP